MSSFGLWCNRWHLVCFSFCRLIIHDVDFLSWFDDSSPQAELQFGLGSSVELLVDGRIIRVEGDVCSSRVGEAIELDLDGRWDGKKDTKLEVD